MSSLKSEQWDLGNKIFWWSLYVLKETDTKKNQSRHKIQVYNKTMQKFNERKHYFVCCVEKPYSGTLKTGTYFVYVHIVLDSIRNH